ncbi:MAG: HD domain-containing phosphohydrolase [Planctomycetota bacterium]
MSSYDYDKKFSAILSRVNQCSEQESLTNACEYLVSCLEASACLVFAYDEPVGELFTYFVLNKTGVIPAGEPKVNIKNGMTGWVIQNLNVLILDETSGDNRYNEELNNLGLSNKGRMTIMTLPVVMAGHLVGVMDIICQGRRRYTRPDLNEFQVFFNLVAMLVTNNHNALAKLAEVCVRFLEERDRGTHGHSLRVANLCRIIAGELGLPETQKRELHLAAILHDIGKVTLKDNLLYNEQQLTRFELQIVRMHPIIGYNILCGVNKGIAKIVRSHHEYYNGSGYPDGIKGSDIPLVSRIMVLADAVDAMISDRPYRRGMPIDDVIKEVTSQSGIQFDPKLVEVFLEAYRKGKLNI